MSLFGRTSTSIPPLPRRLSTGFCTALSTVIPQKIRVFSTSFAHLFHQAFGCAFRGRFPQAFRTDSSEKMGENRAVSKKLWKLRKTLSARRARPESKAGRSKNAHELWHVEHSEISSRRWHPRRRRNRRRRRFRRDSSRKFPAVPASR